MAFSPDEQVLATASWDKTARLWDRSGKELARLPHGGPVYGGGVQPGRASTGHRQLEWGPAVALAAGRPYCRSLPTACPESLTREEWRQYLGEEPVPADLREMLLDKQITQRRPDHGMVGRDFYQKGGRLDL